jgi:hypothetical protein
VGGVWVWEGRGLWRDVGWEVLWWPGGQVDERDHHCQSHPHPGDVSAFGNFRNWCFYGFYYFFEFARPDLAWM